MKEHLASSILLKMFGHCCFLTFGRICVAQSEFAILALCAGGLGTEGRIAPNFGMADATIAASSVIKETHALRRAGGRGCMDWRSELKAMMMVVLGLMLASVGQDSLSDITCAPKKRLVYKKPL